MNVTKYFLDFRKLLMSKMSKISNKVLDVKEVFEESGRSLKFSFRQSIIFPIHAA